MLFLILLSTVLGLGIFFVKRRYSYWAERNVPYLPPSFPYGNMTGFKQKKNSALLMKDWYNALKSKGPFGGVYMFIKPVILALDMDFIKNIMVKDFNYFINRGVYHNVKDDPLSGHLFNIEDQKWRNLRTKLTPTFTSGKMKFMYPTILAVADEFKKCMDFEVDKMNGEIEMKEILSRFTTDVIGTCAFGLECNSLKDPEAEFRKMGQAVFTPAKNIRMRNLITTQFPNLGKKLHFVILKPYITKWFMEKVTETVDYREKNKIQRNDFMNLLIQLRSGENGGMTIEEIAAQAFIFFLAGFETSSTTMSYALYELSQHQDIQDKAREEVKTVLEKYDGKLTYEAMMELKYVEQVLNESLRKYPPVPNLIRRVRKDYKDPLSGVVLKEGQNVFIPVYGIHHDPEYYPNPEVYDPDRFTDEEQKIRNPFTFMPFGEGPRNCIGLRFGMMQAKIGLATLLKNYRFSMGEKTQMPITFIPTSFILSTKGGLWLKAEPI